MSESVAARSPSPVAAEGAAEFALVVEVHFPEGLYHGRPDWPPAPFRLFSALVAGAYGGRWVAEPRADKDAAFRWLERLPPPIVAAPRSWRLAGYTTYVPNNDLDAVEGDPARIGEIRGSTKDFAARAFTAETPFLYVWPLTGRDASAEALAALADRLHTLGRGIDMAFARATILTQAEAEAKLTRHDGPVWRPNPVASGREGERDRRLAVPGRGSFDSLVARHAAVRARFEVRKEGRTRRIVFRQPPVARSLLVGYSTRPTLLTYAIHARDGEFAPLPAHEVVALARRVRDRLVARLAEIEPGRTAEILRFVKGEGARDADKTRRLQFLPLPTIGHTHADFGLRRLLLVVPPECPIPLGDIRWALRGTDLSLVDEETGEVRRDGPVLVEDADDRMATRHYLGRGSRRWRTVTPVALPRPSRQHRRRSGTDQARDDAQAVRALQDALRHAGFDPAGVAITLRQAPHHRHGRRAADFADERFGDERLAHVELTFPEPVHGPLVLGDGRFLGLGLFAPAADARPDGSLARQKWAPSIQTFAIVGGAVLKADAVPAVVAAFRRAVMARVGDELGLPKDLPLFFSGHEPDGAPAKADPHDHLYFALDPGSPPRLLAIAPHRVDRRQPDRHEAERGVLDRALEGLSRLRAGRAGAFDLVSGPEPTDGDALIGPSKTWISATPFRPTRHPKRGDDPVAALAADAAACCRAIGLPEPQVEVLSRERASKSGLAARLRLTFAVAVPGPILLGRDAHGGGGLFLREG